MHIFVLSKVRVLALAKSVQLTHLTIAREITKRQAINKKRWSVSNYNLNWQCKNIGFKSTPLM